MLATRSDGLGDGGDGSKGMVVVVSGDGVSKEIAECGDVHMCQHDYLTLKHDHMLLLVGSLTP